MYYNKTLNTVGNLFGVASLIAILLSLIDKFGFIEAGNAGYWFLAGLATLIISMIFKAISDYFSGREALITFIRIFIGGLFIFSGFVKAIDPLGTAYKMMDYFTEFGLLFLEPFTVGFSVFMIVLELVLGVCLLLAYRVRITMWLLLWIIVFFTFLTGYTSVTGNVTDCGCFGDFLKLKPIESFTKDIVLLIFILILFFNQQLIRKVVSSVIALPVVGLVTISSLLFCFSNYVWDIPVMDFRPYKIGNNVPEQMTVPPDKRPVYEFKFIYKNNNTGEEKSFSTDNLPSGDEWSFVDREDILVKEGETPKIDNFQIVNENGEDISEDILYNPDYLFMVVANDLKKSCAEAFTNKLNPIAHACDSIGYAFFAVTSAALDEREQFRHDNQTAYPFHEADATFLKTIVRSNPGLVILKEGNVIAKWHCCKIPSFKEIQQSYLK